MARLYGKQTPLPWRVLKKGAKVFVVGPNEEPVCNMESDEWSVAEALVDAYFLVGAVNKAWKAEGKL